MRKAHVVARGALALQLLIVALMVACLFAECLVVAHADPVDGGVLPAAPPAAVAAPVDPAPPAATVPTSRRARQPALALVPTPASCPECAPAKPEGRGALITAISTAIAGGVTSMGLMIAQLWPKDAP